MSLNALFAKEQHGFLSRRSCITQLLIATDHIGPKFCSRVTQWMWCTLYFDFKKAFDSRSVPHLRLLLKLKSYGIEGHLLDWVTAFLTNRSRKQRLLLLMNLILVGLMSLVESPKDQCWAQFYSLCILMTYLTHYTTKF